THGGSAIAAAELFLQVAQPPAGATGQGIPMSASDGGFDGAVENVTWQEGLTSAPGTTCVWIHARDAAGNWGPYDSKCFVVIDAAGHTTLSSSMAVKFRLSFTAGLNLLGMPLLLADPTFGAFAAGGAWADAWTYDACGGGNGWSSALPADATTFSLVAGRGFW